MSRLRIVGPVVLALGIVFGVACGGDGDPAGSNGAVLHLDGGNIATDEYRDYLRSRFAADSSSRELCTLVAALSPQGVLDLAGESPGNEEVEFDPLPDGWEAVPGQVADQDELLTSALVFKEECERFIK